MSHQGKILLKLTAIGLAAVHFNLGAASFQLLEQSAAQLGTSYAGTAAEASDVSTGYYNAAGLPFLNAKQSFALSSIGILPHSKFYSSKASPSVVGVPGSPTFSPSVTKGKGNALVPQLHFSQHLSPKLSFGFSINTPFGLQTEYKADSALRYMATRSKLVTLNFSPSLAYKLNDHSAIGFGIDIVAAKANLDAQVGGGTLATDGYQHNQTKKTGFGAHLGYLIELADTRMGINYRSAVRLATKGQSDSKRPAFAGGTLSSQALTAKVTLPESLTFSLAQKLDDKWTMLSDLQWTKWSRFKTLQLNYADGTTSVTPEHYRDTFRLAFGANYKYNDKITYKMGTAFDQSPTRDAYRTARIPDSDRVWLSLGAEWNLSPKFKLSAGLAHLFFKKAMLNETAPQNLNSTPFGGSKASMTGRYRSSANLIGVQLSYSTN